MSSFLSLASGKGTTPKRMLLASFIIAIFTQCSSPENQVATQGLPYTIKVAEAYQQGAEVPLSQFAESVEYIPLETTEGALIGRNASFYLFGDYIISIAFRQVYLFDRKSGAFIKELKRYGQGPDEYRNTQPNIHADEKRGVVYLKDNRNVSLGLNVKGETSFSFKTPQGAGAYIMGYAQLTDDLFVGFQANPVCEEQVKLMIFNKNGEVIKTFANHLQCEQDDLGSISFDSGEGSFYRWNGQVGFKETYNDTLFMVSPDSLSPKAVFDSGDYGIAYKDKKRLEMAAGKDYHLITDLDETDEHLFFRLYFKEEMHSGLYNKQTRETQVVRSDKSDINGFHNDLDNFLPFSLKYATDDQQAVGFIEAPDVITWLEENPEKAKALPTRLKPLSQLKEDDNPVLMIVTLKD